MAADNTESKLKSILYWITPFVSIAFALIQYIYATDSAQSAADKKEAKQDLKELKDKMAEVKNVLTLQTEQIKNNGEKSEANAKAVEGLTTRQNELEKTVILSNVGRR